MKTVAIIQARMTSTRLPGKVMMDVNGAPMLYHVMARARLASAVDLVTVATTTNATDDTIAEYCKVQRVQCFRGSENDVLDRYYQAAGHFGAEVIVRLTADCPLLDPAVIDRVIETFRAGDYDYVSNTIEVSYPDGLDTEVFSFAALGRAWKEANLISEREHVTPYLWKQPGLFRLANVKNETDFSKLRWTVDEPPDLEIVRRVYHYFGTEPAFGMNDVVALLRTHPELCEINADFERNEGYQKSLRDDATISEKDSNNEENRSRFVSQS